MARNGDQFKKIENPTSLRITYPKRRERLVKQVNELIADFCDTDIGLLMFSPSGKLTCVTSPGRKIEDIFLRFINEAGEEPLAGRTIEHEENLYRKLKRSKYEAEMLESIKTKETLQGKLDLLNRDLHVARGKMRYYQPDVMRITSNHEVEEHENYLTNAIQRIRRIKARLQQNENYFRVARPTEFGHILDTSEQFLNSKRMRISSVNGNYHEGMDILTPPPQLGAGYLTNQAPQNVPSAGFASSSTQTGNFNGGQAFQGFAINLFG